MCQFRGSPRIHSFLWLINAPLLTKDTKDEYNDNIGKAQLPDTEKEPQLYEMVKIYQIHSHSKSCHANIKILIVDIFWQVL